MRLVSLKSFCLIASLVVPSLGTAHRANAGIIPRVYDAIFGYGRVGGGYGWGASPYMGYGGYAYSAPVYAAPAYTTNYGSDYGWSGSYFVDSCCCTPCADSCAATSIESAKPAINSPEPTPVEGEKTAPTDSFVPRSPGEESPTAAPERLPGTERAPVPRRSIPGTPDENMNAPVEENPEGLEGTRETTSPATPMQGDSVALRYTPASRRSAPSAVRLTGRVVRTDRPVSGPATPDAQLATR
ncbi:MAG: hypothetical protein DWH91_17985 [Planctomycetota bacterium]|nr:MAG: hypothetical protein DWH91_17985 [Planctomycetota bacterium]